MRADELTEQDFEALYARALEMQAEQQEAPPRKIPMGKRHLRIAFDVGGVLSRYPDTFVPLVAGLLAAPNIQVYVVSDMHPAGKILDMLARNGLGMIPKERVISADYAQHGEACKAEVCREHQIDVLVDDFIGYVATPGAPPVRLLVMPDPEKDYYHPSWRTDGSEGNFGRRRQGKGGESNE